MKLSRLFLVLGGSALVLGLAGCSSDDDDSDPVSDTPTISAVPDSAGVSAGAFISFLLSLRNNDESSEPLIIPNTFAVPPADSAEPTPLI